MAGDSASPSAMAVDSSAPSLCLMTLNMQYFSSYPPDRREDAREELLKAINKLPNQDGSDTQLASMTPDFVCVQEGIDGREDFMTDHGYNKVICSTGKSSLESTAPEAASAAQTVKQMVYGDAAALELCPAEIREKVLVNQIYKRSDTPWKVVETGVVKTSSSLTLQGTGGRAQGDLATRSMVWAKVQDPSASGTSSSVYIMCTHLTGGRFEDQYFLQSLAKERSDQIEVIADFFKNKRPNAHKDDIGILAGDYNATTEYGENGPMSGYFGFGIKNSPGVAEDLRAAGHPDNMEECEKRFKEYMLSPFTALAGHQWRLAYGAEVGITSRFGHLIDHMAITGPVQPGAKVVGYLCNQMKSEEKDTNCPITDHNCVKVVFQCNVTH